MRMKMNDPYKGYQSDEEMLADGWLNIPNLQHIAEQLKILKDKTKNHSNESE